MLNLKAGLRPSYAIMLAAVVACGVMTVFATWGAQTAVAQEEDEAAGAKEAPADTKTTDDTKESTDSKSSAGRSFLGWLIDASGIFGAVLLILSFVMVALITMNVLQVRRDILLPSTFIEQFEQRLTAKDYQGAYEAAKSDDSFVARVLVAGLSKLNRGYSEAIEGMQEVGEDENMALVHRLSYLALIGSIAPMIGLMGTVYGMIMSFEKIAQSTVSPKPAELAEGISTALFTTLEGLLVAIPAMVFYNILRNRVSRFVLEVGMVSEGLMSRFQTRKPAGGAAPAAAPAAP
ncbi:MAG: MotA/TolQ/ExbB proton channel family protein, partial [Planctomycetaceae bacterium]